MRDILHCDLNNFYASVEMLVDPTIKNKPVAVCGDEKDRKGVVLAKNYIAKGYGIKTGQTIYEAKKLCKNLVIKIANFPLYLKYSKKVKNIYLEYTDQMESFGIDEAWLDVTNSKIFGSPIKIAFEIKERVKKEIGLTISIGVSFNKIFAKLGSDMKKPDAITIIDQNNFKQMVWNLPADDMICIGKATIKKLRKYNIFTIGDVANCDLDFMTKKFGKWGYYLHNFANGKDISDVKNILLPSKIKSIGNSNTFYKDLETNSEISSGIYALTDSIVKRAFDKNILSAKTIKVTLKNQDLTTLSKQVQLSPHAINSTNLAKSFKKVASELNPQNLAIRGISLSITNFNSKSCQMSIFDDKKAKLDKTIQNIQQKYGNNAIFRANNLIDKRIGGIKPFNIHPVSFLSWDWVSIK